MAATFPTPNTQFAPARCDVLTPQGRCPNSAAPASLSCEHHLQNPPPPLPSVTYEPRRCAHLRTRTSPPRQCGRAAAAGSDYCWTHSPEDLRDELLEARDEARAWLISKLDRALVKLVDLIDADDERVALQAACQLLDRAGITALTRTQLDAVVTHQAAIDPSLASVDREIESLLSRALVVTAREVTQPLDPPLPTEPPEPEGDSPQ